MSLSQALNQFAQNLGRYPDKGVIQRIGVNRSIAYAVQRGAQKSREVIDTL